MKLLARYTSSSESNLLAAEKVIFVRTNLGEPTLTIIILLRFDKKSWKNFGEFS